MEIEPDGQQFLNARKAEEARAGAGGGPDDPPGPPPPPPSGGGSRTTVVVIGVVVAVLALGSVAFLTLTGDEEGRRELETGGLSAVELRERAEASTTTEPRRETTTTAAPTTTTSTTAPTDGAPVPFPDFGPVQPGGAPTPAAAPCPGGGISMTVGRSSFTTVNGTNKRIDIQGIARNDTNAPVILDLTVTIDHNAVNHPNPWTTAVTQGTPSLSPGAESEWAFSAVFAYGSGDTQGFANVTALGGGFRWADPANASCPTK